VNGEGQGIRRADPVGGEGGALRAGHGPSSTPPSPPPPARDTRVIWHEVECAGYSADLALWEELAEDAEQILDLGCGTGRVALHLARRGHAVIGLEVAPELVAAFNERASELAAIAVAGDAREFSLDAKFDLVVAPMQLLQLFASGSERERCLGCVAAHLAPDGVAAFAIVEGIPDPVDGPPPLPDTREIDGWIYSSLPIEAGVDADVLRARRLRQTVSPDGELSEELDEILLRMLDRPTLEREAEAAGLQPAGVRTVPPSADHVGSTVVLLGKEA
jgi:SAM-dependent methyltransferase